MGLEFVDNLNSMLVSMDISFSEETFTKLLKYNDMVYEENEIQKLTAISEEDSYHLNFADSLSSMRLLSVAKSVCDIGSGAGFPGLALAIAMENTQFTLLDSLNKRVMFLNRVIDELRLENVVARQIRVEDAGRQKEYRESFDVVIARAVARCAVLYEYALPLVKVGGRLIAYKGENALLEANKARNALKILGGDEFKVVKANVPDRNHTLLIAKKTKPTHSKYPRKAGTPTKLPLE